MNTTQVVLPAFVTLLLLIAFGVHRWRLIGDEERIRAKLGLVPPQEGRFAASNRALARLPGLRQLARRARDAALPVGVTDLALIGLAVGYVLLQVLRALLGPTAALPLTLLVVPSTLWMVVDALARRRRERILQQVPDLVRLLAGAAKAGLSMSGSLMHAAADIGEPTASELRRVVLSVELGRPLPDALEEFGDRLGSPDLDVLTSAIAIQQRAGGDLVTLLTRLGLGLEATRRGKREVRSITAGLTSQAYIGVFLGLGGAVVANRVTDGGLERALNKPITAAIFAVACLLLFISVPLTRRMVRIEQ